MVLTNDNNDMQFWGLSAVTINYIRGILEKRIQLYQSRIDCYKELLEEMNIESAKYANCQEDKKK